MTPATINAHDTAELVGLAQKIRIWQVSRGHSDNETLRLMPGLGSTKTYASIRENKTEELDLERWLAEYRTVWALIEELGEEEQRDEELYADLTPVALLRRSIVAILEEKSIRRVILCQGDSGMGKSTALTIVRRDYGQRILRIEASEVWKDNPMALLGAILEALDVEELAISVEGRMRQVLAKFKVHRYALAIDEAHHMGPRCLNTCKTLINLTTCEIVLLALPLLWRRLEKTAYEEVRQLLGNRLADRIKIEGLLPEDVSKVLERRLKCDEPRTATAMIEAAKGRGNFGFIASICDRLLRKKKRPITHEMVIAAIAEEIARR